MLDKPEWRALAWKTVTRGPVRSAQVSSGEQKVSILIATVYKTEPVSAIISVRQKLAWYALAGWRDFHLPQMAAPTVDPRGLGLAQLITSITFGILTTVVVFLRTFIRVRNGVFGADDLLMLIGYVLFAILVGVSSKATYYGAGQRDSVLPEGIYPHGRYYIWLFQIFYCASLVFIKASICDALLRIAVVSWHRVVAWLTLVMAAICAMIVFISLFVLCKPLSATWNGGGKCSPPSALATLACFVSASSILTDIVCAALPAMMLYKAQMKLATKVSISMVLGLGSLASVATIIRMPFVLFYFHPDPNYLYRVCHVSLWCTVEAGIGIVAGSLPALRKLVKRWIKFDSSARQYSPPKPYRGSHGLGITSHIATASRVKGYNISRDVKNDGKDHWDGLDDGSSRRGIIVTRDVEMHTLENNAESVGSRVSDETYARPA
ncbi:related to integral membrane protein PTH11 [Fusarium proliferatum]|nr:related to integral membrane protein PTH11 [Fusarium proliferatum]